MTFDLLALPQGPRGRGKKKCHCTPHSCEQLTHQIWLDFVQWFRSKRDGQTLLQLDTSWVLTVLEKVAAKVPRDKSQVIFTE